MPWRSWGQDRPGCGAAPRRAAACSPRSCQSRSPGVHRLILECCLPCKIVAAGYPLLNRLVKPRSLESEHMHTCMVDAVLTLTHGKN